MESRRFGFHGSMRVESTKKMGSIPPFHYPSGHDLRGEENTKESNICARDPRPAPKKILSKEVHDDHNISKDVKTLIHWVILDNLHQSG